MTYLKLLLTLSFLYVSLYAKDIYPTFILSTKGHVLDFVYDNAKLYVANDVGSVEVFDLQQQKRIHEILLPKFKTTQNEWVAPKIISIDKFNHQLVLVSTTANAYREVWLYDGQQLKQLISIDKKMSVKQANFINENSIMFATIGHEVSLYNQSDNYKTYTKHVENSTFSHMQLTSDKQHILSASESGRVTLSKVSNGEQVKTFESLNVDNINKISYANDVLLTAGQDRRVGIYSNEKNYYIQNDFIVYCAALNSDATLGVFSANENNDLQLFDIKSGKRLHKLIGHYAIPSTIKFINEKEFFSAGYENNIFYWNLNLIK